MRKRLPFSKGKNMFKVNRNENKAICKFCSNNEDNHSCVFNVGFEHVLDAGVADHEGECAMVITRSCVQYDTFFRVSHILKQYQNMRNEENMSPIGRR